LAFDPTGGTPLRESAAQFGELAYQRAHVVFCVAQRGPIHPPDRIVLTVSIVVAALTVADFVSGEHQGHALRQHTAHKLIAPRLSPQLDDVCIVGRSFSTEIRTAVLIGAVPIVLSV